MPRFRPIASAALLAAGLAFSLHPASAQQPSAEACWETASNQRQITACALMELDEAEQQMGALYAIVLDKARGDAVTLRKIRAAQEAWRAFRQAHAEAVFPKADSPEGARVEYGTVFPMCWAGLNAAMTKTRIAQLSEWVDGIEEGDVCAGSRGIARN